MSALLARLDSRVPALWVEVSPPRGINFDSLLRRLSVLVGKVDAINLTDNAMAKVKLSSLIFGNLIKQRLGIPVVLNFSCRDRNLLALTADLLGAAAIGVDAVVALSGDKLEPGGPGQAQGVHHIDAFGLLGVIEALNRGDTGEGKRPLKTLPSIVAGAVANPNRANQERELELVLRKQQGGAKFVLTQPIFDLDRGLGFLSRVRAMGMRTMLGILPVKRAEMADYLVEKVKDLSTAGEHFSRYRGLNEEQARKLSIEHSLELMRMLSRHAAGFNIMSGGGPSLAIDLALEFDSWRSSQEA